MPDDNTNTNENENENTSEKPEVKFFSEANVAYLLTQIAERLKESHSGE